MRTVFTREVSIGAPIDVVWETFSNFERHAQDWMPEVESARVDGELAPGATVEVRVRGKELRSTVAALEPPTRCDLESRQGRMHAVYHYRFTAEDDTTRVELHAEADAGGLLLKLMRPIIHRAIARTDGPSLDNLKRLVESK